MKRTIDVLYRRHTEWREQLMYYIEDIDRDYIEEILNEENIDRII